MFHFELEFSDNLLCLMAFCWASARSYLFLCIVIIIIIIKIIIITFRMYPEMFFSNWLICDSLVIRKRWKRAGDNPICCLWQVIGWIMVSYNFVDKWLAEAWVKLKPQHTSVTVHASSVRIEWSLHGQWKASMPDIERLACFRISRSQDVQRQEKNVCRFE